MPTKKDKFMIYIDSEYRRKIAFIAEENDRSTNQEIVRLIKIYIKDYENVHGQIPIY